MGVGFYFDRLSGILFLSLLVLFLIVWHSACRLRATWQVPAGTGRWAAWQARWCQPVLFRNLYRRWLQWSLNSNPVGWLERRTWTARSVKWGWLAVISALYGYFLLDHSFFRREFTQLQIFFAGGLSASAAFSAAGSFRRERDNGLLSLLLVSPLRVKHIVGGRLRALWGQYLPALLLLFGAWWYLHGTHGERRDPYWVWYFACAFLCLPVIGLYCSLWRRTFFGALLWTAMLGFVLPMATTFPWLGVARYLGELGLILAWVAAGQIALALVCLALLVRKLSRRSFRLPAA